jgi:hypothetical protein
MPANSSKSFVDPLANALAVGLALALALTPRFVPPCAHQLETAAGVAVPMRCHWTFQIEFLLAVAALIVAGALWVVRHAEARRIVGGGLVLFGLLVIAVPQPWVIGLCGNPEMACHHTAHWLWLWAALLMGDGIFIAVRARIPAGQTVPPDPWEDSPDLRSRRGNEAQTINTETGQSLLTSAATVGKGAKSCCA